MLFTFGLVPVAHEFADSGKGRVAYPAMPEAPSAAMNRGGLSVRARELWKAAVPADALPAATEATIESATIVVIATVITRLR